MLFGPSSQRKTRKNLLCIWVLVLSQYMKEFLLNTLVFLLCLAGNLLCLSSTHSFELGQVIQMCISYRNLYTVQWGFSPVLSYVSCHPVLTLLLMIVLLSFKSKKSHPWPRSAKTGFFRRFWILTVTRKSRGRIVVWALGKIKHLGLQLSRSLRCHLHDHMERKIS